MRKSRKRSQLLIVLLAVGFLIGAIYGIFVSDNENVLYVMFQKENLKYYVLHNRQGFSYVCSVLKSRLCFLILTFVVGKMKRKKWLAVFSLAMCGFFIGLNFAILIRRNKSMGVLFGIASMMPHFVCYVLMYMVLVRYWLYSNIRWNRAKTLFVMCMFAGGVFLELYVNPMIMRLIVEWL